MPKGIEQFDEAEPSIALGSLEVGDGGELALREPKFPLTFSFHWRNSRFQGAISNGRCNTGIKPFSRGFKPQCFAWPFV